MRSKGFPHWLKHNVNRKHRRKSQGVCRSMKLSNYPVDGKYGKYGGRFVPEVLMEAISELEQAYDKARKDPEFQKQLDYYLSEFVGRPTPLYLAENLTRKAGRSKNLPQTRRPSPRRSTQNQQHHRTSIACQTNGQNSYHR